VVKGKKIDIRRRYF